MLPRQVALPPLTMPKEAANPSRQEEKAEQYSLHQTQMGQGQ